MQLTAKAVAALVVLSVLWILWCFYAVLGLTPYIELHYAIWHGLTAWILCLLPPFVVATVLVLRIRKGK